MKKQKKRLPLLIADGHRGVGKSHSTEVRFCLCCGSQILKDGHSPKALSPENCMWMGGMVGKIHAGYGSKLDGNVYIIAICDKCAIKKKKLMELIQYSL